MTNTVLITGSNGMIGGRLIKLLLEEADCGVLAVCSDRKKIEEVINRESIVNTQRMQVITNAELLDPYCQLSANAVIHLAFSRRSRPSEQIAKSVVFSADVFKKLHALGVNRVINVSSQGVYGNVKEYRTESMAPAPATAYTMAKYATEILANEIFECNKDIEHTNLRLDLVTQGQNVIVELCKQAVAGEITLVGGRQLFSLIDVNDAARAIVAMLHSGTGWNNTYNVGWNRRRYTLIEMAEIIATAAERKGHAKPAISLEEKDIELCSGMESCLFTQHTGWSPVKDLETTIMEMIPSNATKGETDSM